MGNKNDETSKKVDVLKLKIEIEFCDKYTNVIYKVGDIVEFEKDRYEELLKDERKLVSKVGDV